MKPGPMDKAIKPLKWIIGTWRSISGKGIYPTIKNFSYKETLTFISVGQPMLNYTAVSYAPTKEARPIHLEAGFLRINPGTTQVSFLLAHNFGVVTVEEGCVEENAMNLETIAITPLSFFKGVKATKLVRKFCLNTQDNILHVTLDMATEKTKLTNHLKASYKKC